MDTVNADNTKTKIVCTIGPATSSKPSVTRLVRAGMNVARLNFSHGSLSDHASRIRIIREVSHVVKKPVGILVDLPGPKIRVGKISPDPAILRDGSHLTLTDRSIVGNQTIVSVTHSGFLKELEKGDIVFLEDGTVRLKVQELKNGRVICKVIRGGGLSSGKGVNLPEKKLSLSALTSRDLILLRFALEHHADFIGLSFAMTSRDVQRTKRLVRKANSQAWVIAKIEKRQAVQNIDDIVKTADAIMVARGDLGVEMEVEEIPELQKSIIARSNAAGKPVITATQMLESMVNNPTPTRAEVTDVANAIIDGTDAVMLSEETAVGKYPIEAVKVMKRIASATERTLPYTTILDSKRQMLTAIVQDSISFSACRVAHELGANCIVAHTRTGLTAHRVSKFRSPVPIIALTYSEEVMNRLSLPWGVYPRQVRKQLSTTAEIFSAAKTAAIESGFASSKGDRIVVVCGDPSTPGGTTDLLRVQTI
jgi:pyruvate kinase